MTEHSGENGIDPPHYSDSEHEHADAAPPSGQLDSPLGTGHEVPFLPDHQEHEDPFAYEPLTEPHTAGEHVDGDASREGDVAEWEVREQSTLQSALAGPGGSVFDLLPEAEPAWAASADSHFEGGAIGADDYAGSWASDDGTGVIAVMHGADGPNEHTWEPDERCAGSASSHIEALLYRDDGSARDTAMRLWAEFAPGDPEPSGADGEPLAASELLRALSRHLEDPSARSVIEAALGHVSTKADRW